MSTLGINSRSYWSSRAKECLRKKNLVVKKDACLNEQTVLYAGMLDIHVKWVNFPKIPAQQPVESRKMFSFTVCIEVVTTPSTLRIAE